MLRVSNSLLFAGLLVVCLLAPVLCHKISNPVELIKKENAKVELGKLVFNKLTDITG